LSPFDHFSGKILWLEIPFFSPIKSKKSTMNAGEIINNKKGATFIKKGKKKPKT
jgi:hypothetical protein